MNIGITYDEKFFNKDNMDLILKAKQLGVKSLEIVPDLEIMDVEEYMNIIKFANQNSLDINFHIPNFKSELYNPKSLLFDKDKTYKKYDDFFNLLSKLVANHKSAKPSVLVIHGEDFELSENKSVDRTKLIIEYCLKKIKELNLNILLGIETLRRSDKKRVGDNHEEILSLINSIKDNEKLGICLDICHDSMNTFPNPSYYSDEFLEKLIYIHLHGIDLYKNNAHTSIMKSSVNFLNPVLFLNENTNNLTLNLELLMDNIGESYISDLFYDLSILNKIL